MVKSINGKLIILLCISFIFTLLLSFSFLKIHSAQHKTTETLRYFSDLQENIDALRSQLWLFSQRQDQASLQQVVLSHESLSQLLITQNIYTQSVFNLQKLTDDMGSLLTQEQALSSQSSTSENSHVTQAQQLLRYRYNILIENMSEEVAYLNQTTLDSNQIAITSVMLYSSLGLILAAIIVLAMNFSIYQRFKIGFNRMKLGIHALSKGEINHKIHAKNLDEEFRLLASFFNQMTKKLETTMVSKQELEQEVNRQTSELEKQKQQLLVLSEKDHLTGLMNRRALERALDNVINDAHISGSKVALFFLDIDNFKIINDSIGHDAGDTVLQQVAQRLQECTRKADIVGRLGGDEFLVCLGTIEDFDQIGHKAQSILDSVSQPIEFNGNKLSITTSMGVSYFPFQARSRDSLIKRADQYMYKAKQFKGSCCYDGQEVLAQSNIKAHG
ncbi:diguanylate cyclase [Shewanella electrodiphila]|uniref:Diguanylate cyclase n=1 Tax=Shewanella electrodiphila TaxID=934143 RepID=A0ABT0KQB9_9GAMM|nr:GGDEF domain-containing protein [Shewanella electrodiphila]MCL1045979.1 diguanylate cyclase [Shewanella electrodiphila]